MGGSKAISLHILKHGWCDALPMNWKLDHSYGCWCGHMTNILLLTFPIPKPHQLTLLLYSYMPDLVKYWRLIYYLHETSFLDCHEDESMWHIFVKCAVYQQWCQNVTSWLRRPHSNSRQWRLRAPSKPTWSPQLSPSLMITIWYIRKRDFDKRST